MPLVIRSSGLGMDSDEQSHPRENRLVVVTVVLAIIALGCSFVESLHILASIAGLLGMIVGLWAQMVSATTAQRWIIVIALGAATIGFAFGLANGGFLP
jgi:hypothetical protein